MDVRALIHNRWFLGAAGVAGAAGIYTLYRRRSSSGGGSSGGGAGAQATPAYASGSVGGFDSTGTDVAAWLGNYSQNLDNQFKEFTKTVEDRLAAIPAGTNGTGTQTPSNAPQVNLPSSLTVPAGTNLYNWAQQTEGQYGSLITGGQVFDQIRGQGSIQWLPAGSLGADPQYGKVPIFSSSTTVTVH